MANVAHDVRLRFQNDIATLNRALNRPVHNQLLGLNWPRDAVTLPTIFSPSAVTVPRCFNSNMLPSYTKTFDPTLVWFGQGSHKRRFRLLLLLWFTWRQILCGGLTCGEWILQATRLAFEKGSLLHG